MSTEAKGPKAFTFHQVLDIAGRRIGPGHPVFMVAEAGVAHFGSLEKALALVELAAEAGADAVKFQIFKTEALISPAAPEWRRRLASRELPYAAFERIAAHCRERGILFFATAHDEPSLEFLDTLGVPVYKVGSGEVNNWAFTEKVAARGKPVIISTGMYRWAEVEAAAAAVARSGNRDLALLQCVTRYPTPPAEVNLRAMDTIRERLGVVTGYSDHTAGYHIPLAAVARGASILEKHISLDFNVPDAQDWLVSCGPHDLAQMVRQLREVEAALGSGQKQPTPEEEASKAWARKSLVAAQAIAAGETIGARMLAARRPGTGIAPEDLPLVVGRRARRRIEEGSLVSWEDLL